MDRVTRAQVRNLEERSALWVSRHLVMAGRLLDIDPELAFQHALAASRRGGRLAAVREAVGLTAYAAGHYGEALREFRTFRRISGSNVHLPVMADCERGLGRPDRALDLARSEEAASLDAAGKAELAMVVSGARTDLGQLDAAVAALEIPQLDLQRAFAFSPRLFRAYAEALDAVGRSGESGKWRRQAGVAERALGLEDDLEPDIIDLGEDDEPAPVPVPRVADLLGVPASTGGAAESDDLSAGSGGEAAGDAGEANAADSEHEPAVDAEAEAEAKLEVETQAEAEAKLEVETQADAEAEPEAAAEAEAEPKSQAEAKPEPQPEAEAEAEPQPEPEAGPEVEAAAPVGALQTEMLFSMDDPGAADPETASIAGKDETGAAAGSAVRFSAAGSDPGATEGNADGDADGTADGDAEDTRRAAPKRKRTPRAAASQDDGVDD
ncbi:hypothetical protein [Arthrobacter sp. MDT1-65]